MRARELEIAEAFSTLCLFNLGYRKLGAITVIVSGEHFRIEIKKARSAGLRDEPIWDQVTIDGIPCGNRFGGRTALMIMLGLAEPQYEFADRHYVARRDAIRAKKHPADNSARKYLESLNNES